MSTSTKHLRQWSIGWCIWSLLRVDLFIFYGFTLFLQTFIFPFSLLGYCTNRIRKKNVNIENKGTKSVEDGDVALNPMSNAEKKDSLVSLECN